jgi:benzoyl-CoA reductase/2-hydroxyglutaryl-CoA dehydratase subunit BcrC/BadD/HgdB
VILLISLKCCYFYLISLGFVLLSLILDIWLMRILVCCGTCVELVDAIEHLERSSSDDL